MWSNLFFLFQLLENVSDGDLSQETADIKLPLEVANSEIMTKDKEIIDLQESLEKAREAQIKVCTLHCTM